MSAIELLPISLVIMAITFSLKDIKNVFLPKLLADKPFQHFVFFAMLGLFFLWSAQAGIKENLSIHFLGLTIFTLVFGWRTAFLLTIPVTLGLCLTQQLPYAQLFDYLFISSLIPITISYMVFVLSFRYLPKNIFIYIFIAGFFNGGLTSSTHFVFNSLLHVWQGNYDWQTITNNYLMFLPLLAFPEGLLNGMAAAVMSVFKPEWLRTFSDSHYIYHHSDKN